MDTSGRLYDVELLFYTKPETTFQMYTKFLTHLSVIYLFWTPLEAVLYVSNF